MGERLLNVLNGRFWVEQCAGHLYSEHRSREANGVWKTCVWRLRSRRGFGWKDLIWTRHRAQRCRVLPSLTKSYPRSILRAVPTRTASTFASNTMYYGHHNWQQSKQHIFDNNFIENKPFACPSEYVSTMQLWQHALLHCCASHTIGSYHGSRPAEILRVLSFVHLVC